MSQQQYTLIISMIIILRFCTILEDPIILKILPFFTILSLSRKPVTLEHSTNCVIFVRHTQPSLLDAFLTTVHVVRPTLFIAVILFRL